MRTSSAWRSPPRPKLRSPRRSDDKHGSRWGAAHVAAARDCVSACERKERYMTTLYETMQQVSAPAIPRELVGVILFCMLGLTISLAALPWLDADTAEFILTHLQ